MWNKKGISLLLSSVLVFSSTQVNAGPREVGVGIGLGVGLGILLNEAMKPKGGPRDPRDKNLGPVERYRRPSKSPEQIAAEEAEQARKIQEMADIQLRLNALHFNAGDADGKAGAQTKTAIKEFQRSLNQAPTGELTPSQKSMLIASTTTAPVAPATAFASPPPAAPAPAANSSPSPTPQFSPQDPFANATPMLPQPASLAPAPSPAASPATPEVQTPASARVDTSASVLGVSPMMTEEEALAALKTVHLADWCSKSASAIVCRSSDSTMSDEVIVGVASTTDGIRVHSVIRTMRFSTPVARASIDGQMRQSYPALFMAENGVTATGADCDRTMQAFRANDFQALRQWVTSTQPSAVSVAPLVAACQSYSELAVPAGDTIPSLTIALFSGRPLAAASNNQAPTIRF